MRLADCQKQIAFMKSEEKSMLFNRKEKTIKNK